MNNEMLSEIYSLIDKKLSEKHIVLAIDGQCGAGKTTLANLLCQKYDCNLIHTDHFFLPLTLKTKERLEEVGGNVHYERLFDEVIKGLNDTKPFSYRVFDCKSQVYTDVATLYPKTLTIIEGSYSMHPYFGDVYDINLFVTCDESTQEKRIIERNGATGYKKFKELWIPMEKKYFNQFKIKEKADLVIENN